MMDLLSRWIASSGWRKIRTASLMTWSIANHTTLCLYHQHIIKLGHSILLQRRLHGPRGWQLERLRGTQASTGVQCISCYRLEPVDSSPSGSHPDALWTHQGTPTGQFSMTIIPLFICILNLLVHYNRQLMEDHQGLRGVLRPLCLWAHLWQWAVESEREPISTPAWIPRLKALYTKR